jgi:hypothetical protein
MPRLGSYSSASTLKKLDGRSKEARLLRSLRAELTAHVGGTPTPTQRVLIDQAVQLQLRIALMDADGVTTDSILSERNTRQYLAWANSLTRIMRQLGLKSTAPVRKPVTLLEEHMARRSSAA